MKQSPAVFDTNFALAYQAFKKKINTFARNSSYAIEGYDVEDVEQELCMILAKCVRDYDPDRGASFNTLVQGSFQRRIGDLIRKMNTQSRKATYVYLDDDEVRLVVEGAFNTASAEDEVMARLTVAALPVADVTKALTLTPLERKRLRKSA